MNYRKEIDGLRALAIIPVVLFHAGFKWMSGGFLGVDVFFVISGYLITSIITSDLDKNQFSFLKFYERRARRILPALFFIMAISILFAWALIMPSLFIEFTDAIVYTVLFMSNIYFAKHSGYFANPEEENPMMHTWSLSIEEQFYLFFPIILILIWRFCKSKSIPILIFIILASLIYAQIEEKRIPVFFSLFSRAWELATGALLAILERKKGRSSTIYFSNYLPLIGVVMILASMFNFNESTHHPGLITAIPVIGTALIIWFGQEKDLIVKFLSLRFMVGIGLISYSLYLWHHPIFAFARIYSLKELTAITYLSLILITVFLSYLTWRFIETPFRRNKITTKTLWVFSFSCITIFFVFGKLCLKANGFPERFSPQQRQIAKYMKHHSNLTFRKNGTLCNGRDPKNACVLGESKSHPTIALVGDSHAGCLGKGLDKVISKTSKTGILLHSRGCAYSIGLDKKDNSLNCYKNNLRITEKLKDKNLDTIILAGRYVHHLEGVKFDNYEGGKESRQNNPYVPKDKKYLIHNEALRKKEVAFYYKKTIEDLLKEGKRVVLVYPIPEVGVHVPLARFKMSLKGIYAPITTSYARYIERSENVFNVFDSIKDQENLIRIFPHELLCNKESGRCKTSDDEKIYYADTHHLSLDGGDLIVDEIINKIEEKWKSF